MRLPRLCVPPCLVAAVFLRSAALADRVETLFWPLQGEMITLSPDGCRVAYASTTRGQLAIVIMNIEPPGPKRVVKIDPDRDPEAAATPGDQVPTQLRFLRWATNTRLVFAPVERVVPLPPIPDKQGRLIPNPDGPVILSPILAMDADGKQRGTVIDARHFQETPREARKSLADLLRTTKELQATRSEPLRWRMPHLDILGFLPRDREQLILQTQGAYSMPMQHLVDLRTGSVREFGAEWPAPPGEPRVFDWYRLKIVGERKEAARPAIAWRDADMAHVQRELETKFPRRAVEILDWSETRARVLFRVTGGTDAGRFFVYQRPEDIAVEILQRAPWLTPAKLNETRFFEFASPDGAPLSGYVTWPREPRVVPPALLVMFPRGFPGHAQPAFDPEAQVFADMGFVVARLNHRSVAGIRSQDLNALRSAVDRVAADDARTAIGAIAARNPHRQFDGTRVATLGRGFGGYLAVRALQLEPNIFHCGIAIDAPLDLRAWQRSQPPGTMGAAEALRDIPVALIDHEDAEWSKLSAVEQAETLTHPLLLLVEPARHFAVDASTRELRTRLQRIGRDVDYVELEAGFAKAQPASRATVYRQVDEFLHLHLDGYAVGIGAAKEIP